MATSLPAAERVLCSWCARPWLSSQYKTCDDCRQRAAHRRRLKSRLLAPVQERPSVPVPAPPLPPPVPDISALPKRCSGCCRPWYFVRFKTCETCRRRNRQHRLNRLPTARPGLWWERLSRVSIQPFRQDWAGQCSFCGIVRLSQEPDGWCCNKGRRRLPQLPPCEELLLPLLDRYGGRLSAMSRRVNNLFAFSAIGTTGRFVQFQGLSNVVLEGRVYHRLLDVAEKGHSMHWFLYDETERAQRARRLEVPEDILQIARNVLIQVSPYVRVLSHAVSQVSEHASPLGIELCVPPAGGELAAVINTENLRYISTRKIVFFRKGGLQPRFVPILSCQYEPLQYPLLFPHGTPGWGFLESSQKNLPCTQIQWYRHLFLTEPRMLIFGRLACEYAVDMFSRTEEERLQYLKMGRHQQATGMDEAAHPDAPDLFQNKIPASFMGSRAWASDQVADSLAMARELGKPSFFLTMTTNPNWPEIQSQLLPNQEVSDIPAVVCRVFYRRLHALKAFLRQNFGPILYEISVTEFQKRGLPHAHIIIKVSRDPPLSELDTIISAELPDPVEKPTLYAAVKRFHTHSRDHLTRPTSRCNRNGRCIYGYPQPINSHTYIDDLGRMHYRRRREEDRWVTPHVPALIELMDCHIFVDVCSTALIFFYLFKYLFKGPDRTRFSLRGLSSAQDGNEPADEYEDYVNARYLSSSEAVYRIFAFETVRKTPAVRCLPVHLQGKNLPRMRRPAATGFSAMSDLLWYFQRPTTSHFRQLKYPQFFSLYYLETQPLHDPLHIDQIPIATVDTERGLQQKVLRRRSQGAIVTRLQTVPVRSKELFYLRALLQVRPASSFQDLRTVHDDCYQTYQEAATALGLFQDVREAVYAMNDAISACSRPSQLRFLFTYLLLDLPFPAVDLWTQFQQELCADYRLDHNLAHSINLALEDIARYLSSQGFTLAQCGLPEPQHHDSEVDLELTFFRDRLATLRRRSEAAYARMNTDQQSIFDDILRHCGCGGCFFIDGRAGRGKTFLISAICDHLRANGEIVCVTGTTALSVIHYERGRTAHSAFGIPVQESDVGLQSKISFHSGRAELLRQAAIIIWEELPMAKKAVLECANQLLQDVMGNDLPFGDKLFIGLGDFRQVAPVIRGSSGPTATLNSSIRTSELWDHFQILRLTDPIRTAGDPAYARWVDQVGDGRAPYEASVSLQHLRHLTSLNDSANFLFLDDALQTSPAAIQRAFLSPFNARVDVFNGLMLEHLSAPATTYYSQDTIKELDDTTFHLPTGAEADLLSMLNESGVPPHALFLKNGCIASIMRNLCVEKGLVKNVRIQVVNLLSNVVEVQLLQQLHPISDPADSTFYLPRIMFEFKPQRANWTVQRRQFPLRLAYATTFNSCQGLTLDRVVLDLTMPVFSHGQLYTSLSRVRTADDICILRDTDETDHSTLNVVYPDLLLPG